MYMYVDPAVPTHDANSLDRQLIFECKLNYNNLDESVLANYNYDILWEIDDEELPQSFFDLRILITSLLSLTCLFYYCEYSLNTYSTYINIIYRFNFCRLDSKLLICIEVYVESWGLGFASPSNIFVISEILIIDWSNKDST
jgi:hypothetical protein